MLPWIRILTPLLLVATATATASAGAGKILHYNAAGETSAPARYRDWIFLSSGLNMNYSPGGPSAGDDTFDNVFVDPAS